MNIEMQLLSLLVSLGTLEPALAWGITADDFVSASARHLFGYLLAYADVPGNKGALPGFHNLSSKFPSFQECHDASMTVEALCTEVRDNRVKHETRKAIEDANTYLDTQVSPQQAVALLLSSAERLTSLYGVQSATTFASAVPKTLARYAQRTQGIFDYAIEWPWPEMTAIAGGIMSTDFTLYYGRPKNKKTFVALYHAIDCFRRQHKRVILYSKEMPEEEIWDRAICFMAGIPYDTFNSGQLQPNQYADLLQAGAEAEDLPRLTNGAAELLCLSGYSVPEGQDNVAWLSAMAVKYQADVIFIDGVYLMASTSKSKDAHARAEAISRAVRAMALRLRKPVIATIQANRKADKSGLVADGDEVAFSDAFTQDATAMLRMVANPFEPTCNVLLPGSRKFKLDGFRIWAKPCTDFSWIERLDEAKASQSLADDDARAAGTVVSINQGKKGKRLPKKPPSEEPVDASDLLDGLE